MTVAFIVKRRVKTTVAVHDVSTIFQNLPSFLDEINSGVETVNGVFGFPVETRSTFQLTNVSLIMSNLKTELIAENISNYLHLSAWKIVLFFKYKLVGICDKFFLSRYSFQAELSYNFVLYVPHEIYILVYEKAVFFHFLLPTSFTVSTLRFAAKDADLSDRPKHHAKSEGRIKRLYGKSRSTRVSERGKEYTKYRNDFEWCDPKRPAKG